jgi:alpha-beta hydrolase superfamily lysophospholipase
LEALSKDIDLLLSQARALSPGKPLFLYGHSLGGILVLYYGLVRRPALAGVISTSPGLHTALESQKGKVLLAKVLGLLAPSFVMPSGLDAQAICRDQAVVEAYVNDSLVHDRMSLGLAVELLEAIQTVLTRAPEFPVPLLLMHGSEDRIAFAESSREVASLVKAECTLKLWEGLSHETHNEPEKAQVLAYMIGWLDEHLPAA